MQYYITQISSDSLGLLCRKGAVGTLQQARGGGMGAQSNAHAHYLIAAIAIVRMPGGRFGGLKVKFSRVVYAALPASVLQSLGGPRVPCYSAPRTAGLAMLDDEWC